MPIHLPVCLPPAFRVVSRLAGAVALTAQATAPALSAQEPQRGGTRAGVRHKPRHLNSAGNGRRDRRARGADLTRAPMRPEKPDEVVYELATEITELDAHRLQIKLREGVTFHDGKPFTAEDVKATFEYGALPDRPGRQFEARPGPARSR
ncbi:ABC transporter substrate-binding protein [Paracoccus mutanolyticus]|uniref:ABC transporter substrate-binding protein n=1 Tax=Paracoccus mutanolyticus TaxID=1499308 RepID=UPI001CB96B9C|nr:ABC transporter substrate-binding protein [Paracoccus mutanolyticus]